MDEFEREIKEILQISSMGLYREETVIGCFLSERPNDVLFAYGTLSNICNLNFLKPQQHSRNKSLCSNSKL